MRVGLEDNLVYEKGAPATNVARTQRMVRIIRELGMEPATAAEAREIMGRPALDRTPALQEGGGLCTDAGATTWFAPPGRAIHPQDS